MEVTGAILFFLGTLLPAMASASTPCPVKCQCDQDYIRVKCANGVSGHTLVNIPPRTKFLNIHGSQTLLLTNATFKHRPDLVNIDLSNNGHLKFEGDPFAPLFELQTLKLNSNGLLDVDVVGLEPLPDIVTLILSDNFLTNVPSNMLMPGYSLQHLDLANNNLTSIPTEFFQNFPGLLHLNLSYNNLVDFEQELLNTSHYEIAVRVLDLSYNALISLGRDGLLGFDSLTHLYLEGNELVSLDPLWFHHLTNLTHLSLAYNPIISIPEKVWSQCASLTWLNISFMENLSIVNTNAFFGLHELAHLDLSHNNRLSYIHALTFKWLTSLSRLDLSHNDLSTIDIATFSNMSLLEVVNLAGNPWNCNCDTHWLGPQISNISDDATGTGRNGIFNADDFVCASPKELQGLHLMAILPTHNFSCHGARIVNFTEIAFHAIGSAAVINCVAEGDPLPHITWVTPRKYVIRYQPTFVHPGRPGPQYPEFHQDHVWHNSMEYVETLSNDHRIHVLANGSLYIDYVLRSDAGPYTCLVHNQYGNDSVKIHFRLNYLILPKTMVRSMIVGFISALGFFALGLITALIRYFAYKCSREQRQKRKSIREILEGLETYRSDKMDKLSAYKTAKIDQLAAFKTAKVDKLRGYKNITVQSLVQYLHRSREHYTNQTQKIKDNCAQQVEKVRESYSLQKLKFKDYRSHQVEKIKDNYNGQLLKIRQYGSGQLERLRDQYKLQQQHILKLLELLDIGNCMTVIEAECLRTESMIFNSDLTFDLEAAVYMPRDDSQSEYMTAGDTTDNSSEHSHTGTINFEVKLDNEITPCNALEVQKPKSLSTSTLTQQKVDQSEKIPTNGDKLDPNVRDSESVRTSTSNGASNGNGKETSSKSRTSRKRHRHKPQRQETKDDDEEDIEKHLQKRRGASRERKEKREQKRAALKAIPPKQSEIGQRSEKVIRSPEEINRTLKEIALDLDKLKREPLTLSLPDLNFDLSHGIFTDEDQTPMQPNYPTYVSEYVYHSPPAEHATGEVLSDITPQDKCDNLRREFQQGSNQGSTDVPSTDYESAQEPESGGATPRIGFYEHTGSPQSFASFPSTPSTPTLPADGHHVVIIKPDVESSPNHLAKESSV